MEEEIRRHAWTIIRTEVLGYCNDGTSMKKKKTNNNNNNKLFLLLRFSRIVFE